MRTGFFEPDQFHAVRHLSPPLRALMTFSYITGWRKSDVLSLQWRQIDFQNGVVMLDPGTTKNDEGRVFPFTQELRDLLRSQKVATDQLQREKGIVCPWVFHLEGRPIKSYDGTWRSACKAAGVPGRHVHDFRRTTVRRLEQAGVSRSVGMKLTGHKTEPAVRDRLQTRRPTLLRQHQSRRHHQPYPPTGSPREHDGEFQLRLPYEVPGEAGEYFADSTRHNVRITFQLLATNPAARVP